MKFEDSAPLSRVKKGESDKFQTQEYYHKKIWSELNLFVEKLILNQLNQNNENWISNPNEWQQGRLTGYYWNRVCPDNTYQQHFI